jgi:hypothetical protein
MKALGSDTLSAEELARYVCNDCGVNVVEIGEFYMCPDKVWKGELGLGWEDNLCLGCLDERLGREAKSFCELLPIVPPYKWMRMSSDRMSDRFGFMKGKSGKWIRKPVDADLSSERKTREYAIHLGLRVVRRGDELVLYDCQPGSHRLKSVIGTYRAWATVKRAIRRYGEKRQAREEMKYKTETEADRKVMRWRECYSGNAGRGRLLVHNQVWGNGSRAWSVDDCKLARSLYKRCSCARFPKEHYRVPDRT